MKNKQNKNEAFAAQQKLALIQLLGELPNYICLLIAGLMSKSILAWVDFIDSAGVLFRAGFLLLLSGKLKKDLSYQFNYGIGKVEAVASLCCDILLLGSLSVAAVFAMNDLLHPQSPSGLLFWVVILKIENVVFDTAVIIKQRKNWVNSKLFQSEYAANIKNLLFDGALFITLTITYFLRDFRWAWYFSPICSIAFVVIVGCFTVLRMRKAIVELMDTTCDEQVQRNIVKVLVALYDYYDEFIEVKSRMNAEELLIDIYLRFLPETTYAQIEEFSQIASKKIRELNPNSVVSVVIQKE